jgi:hypothetical protein
VKHPILGYRCWVADIVGGGVRLRGVLAPTHWKTAAGAWTEAVCTPPEGDGPASSGCAGENAVPRRDCSCGLHAYHSLRAAGMDGHARGLYPKRFDDRLVWGAAIGAGRVLVYDDGWRAQYARPVALLSGSGFVHHLRGVAEQLGIPVVGACHIARVAAEFGEWWDGESVPAHDAQEGWRPPGNG